MGAPVRLRIQGYVETAEGGPQEIIDASIRYALTAALGKGDRRQYSVSAATFQALTVPTNATYCLIEIPAEAESLFLKNITGDTTGIALTNATAANVPKMYALIPVDGTTPGLGILNSGDGTIVLTVTMI